MKKVTILGGNGKIAQALLQELEGNEEFNIQLFVRNPEKLVLKGDSVFIGDAMNEEDIAKAIQDADIVYSNLGPMNTDKMVDPIIQAMKKENKKRIIWISTLGVYDEVVFSEEATKRLKDTGFIDQNKYVVDKIEQSDLIYTIIRPNWITYTDELSYNVYKKGEAIKGSSVSQKSIVDLLLKILKDKSGIYSNQSLGISDPKSKDL